MPEYNLEVNKNDQIIGKRPRKDFYTGQYIHRASHLILFNSKNQILLQKRVKTKKWFPNLYTFSVAATVSEESYKDCLKREIPEEIGISIPIKFLFKYPFFDKTDKAFHAVFISKSDKKIKPDKREISEIIWLTPQKLKQDLKANPKKYTPPFRKGMEIFFTQYYKK
ncbi:MAG: NUDIX domain-containing protein [Patescibacteria group bacterium]|nr:NUDIX domain-containing protein [Patescibacteria group bacterium]